MKLNELIDRMPAMYYSAAEKGGPSYAFYSDPGRGKTSVLSQFPKIMKRIDPDTNWGFGLINGANFTLMTAMGFMVWDNDAKGRAVSRFSLPYWYYTVDENGHRTTQTLDEFDGGILLVDEFDKLGMDEKKIVGEAALSKVLGNHSLPDGWVVMFAGNYLHNRSGSSRDLDHLITRRITLNLTDDLESFMDFGRSINMLPETLTFAEENPTLLFEPQPADQRSYCTPRSLHQMDIHLRSLMSSFDTDKIPVDPLTQEEIAGGIGKPAGAQFVKTILLGQQCPDYDDVIRDPMGVTLPSKPDAQRLTAYKIAHKVTIEDATQALKYMARMPSEHQTMFVRMAVQRNYNLVMHPDFAKFCGKNAELIAILTKYKAG